MQIETFKVYGKRAAHSVTVMRQAFASYDEWEKVWIEQGKPWKGASFKPENGAEFLREGAATGWLKKFLKKDGWPDATKWTIEVTFLQDRATHSIGVYLQGD